MSTSPRLLILSIRIKNKNKPHFIDFFNTVIKVTNLNPEFMNIPYNNTI